MIRIAAAALALFFLSCGDLESNRVCLGRPCPIPGQASAECLSYVACYEKTGGTVGSLDSTYGQGGVCWQGFTSTSDSCTAACRSGLDALNSIDSGC